MTMMIIILVALIIMITAIIIKITELEHISLDACASYDALARVCVIHHVVIYRPVLHQKELTFKSAVTCNRIPGIRRPLLIMKEL